MISINDLKKSSVSLVSVFASLVGAAALAFVTQVILGRMFSVDVFGIFATSLSIIAIGAAISSFGIPSYWLLCFGREGEEGRRWLKPSVTVLLALVPVVCIGILGYVNILAKEDGLGEVTNWLLLVLIAQVIVDLLVAKLQIEGRYATLSIWQMSTHLSRLMVVLTALILGFDDIRLIAMGYALFSIMLIVLAYRELSRPWQKLPKQSIKESRPGALLSRQSTVNNVIRGAWPFAATSGLVMLYGKIEIVLLGTIDSPFSAGIFGVASAFLLVGYLVPQALFQKFLLPKIHRWFHHDRDKFVAVYKFNSAAMLVLGSIGSILVYLLAQPIVQTVFGEKYEASGGVLSWLAICILLRFVSTSVGSTLISGDNIRRKVNCQALVALISLIMASYLITHYGIKGAIISKIITELSLLAVYMYTASRFVLGHRAWKGWSLRLER